MTNSKDCSVYVGNLREEVTDDILHELFVQAGPVHSVYIPRNRDEPSKHRGFGFVRFHHSLSVPYAEEVFKGTELYGSAIVVRRSTQTSGGASGGGGLDAVRDSWPPEYARYRAERDRSVRREYPDHGRRSPDRRHYGDWDRLSRDDFDARYSRSREDDDERRRYRRHHDNDERFGYFYEPRRGAPLDRRDHDERSYEPRRGAPLDRYRSLSAPHWNYRYSDQQFPPSRSDRSYYEGRR
ncbi:RNA-binding protein 7-like [Oscarella lobularis]|uniref:RNA-binding protein 7-like n=1 Tax=Oscarella lobularis TaxID=121494 RepID=UPI0033143C0E